jgi:hypothetical protein
MDNEVEETANAGNALADFIVEFLRGPGDVMRDWVLAVPMWMAKGFFILYFVILISWVITIPKDEMRFKLEKLGKEISLRPFAVVSLCTMIIIYLIF